MPLAGVDVAQFQPTLRQIRAQGNRLPEEGGRRVQIPQPPEQPALLEIGGMVLREQPADLMPLSGGGAQVADSFQKLGRVFVQTVILRRPLQRFP